MDWTLRDLTPNLVPFNEPRCVHEWAPEGEQKTIGGVSLPLGGLCRHCYCPSADDLLDRATDLIDLANEHRYKTGRFFNARQ